MLLGIKPSVFSCQLINILFAQIRNTRIGTLTNLVFRIFYMRNTGTSEALFVCGGVNIREIVFRGFRVGGKVGCFVCGFFV